MSKVEFGLLLLAWTALPLLMAGMAVAMNYSNNDVSEFENCDDVYNTLHSKVRDNTYSNKVFETVEASNNCKMLNHIIAQNDHIIKQNDWNNCIAKHKEAHWYSPPNDDASGLGTQSYDDLERHCGVMP